MAALSTPLREMVTAYPNDWEGVGHDVGKSWLKVQSHPSADSPRKGGGGRCFGSQSTTAGRTKGEEGISSWTKKKLLREMAGNRFSLVNRNWLVAAKRS